MLMRDPTWYDVRTHYSHTFDALSHPRPHACADTCTHDRTHVATVRSHNSHACLLRLPALSSFLSRWARSPSASALVWVYQSRPKLRSAPPPPHPHSQPLSRRPRTHPPFNPAARFNPRFNPRVNLPTHPPTRLRARPASVCSRCRARTRVRIWAVRVAPSSTRRAKFAQAHWDIHAHKLALSSRTTLSPSPTWHRPSPSPPHSQCMARPRTRLLRPRGPISSRAHSHRA